MDLQNYLHDHIPLFFALISFLGLCGGSFINVVIHRLPLIIERANRQIALDILGHPSKINSTPYNLWRPQSYCPHCKNQLSTWRKIPLISYILLKGQAKCCKKRIPLRYFLVEALSLILITLLGLTFGPTFQFFSAALLTLSLIALFFIDIDTFMLPDQITLPFLWLGLLINAHVIWIDLVSAILGAIYGYVFFYLLSCLIFKLRQIEGLGHGDLKFISMLGAWLGWQRLPFIILISSSLGLLFGIFFIIKNKKKITTYIPFGPFLSIAGFITLFDGQPLFNLLFSVYPVC
jgi:leader peptidase (prepilin peptidase) / N-methyltransferase